MDQKHDIKKNRRHNSMKTRQGKINPYLLFIIGNLAGLVTSLEEIAYYSILSRENWKKPQVWKE